VRWFAAVVVFVALAASMVWVDVSAQSPSDELNQPLLYTSTPHYDADAWLHGGERFPAGAQLMVREGATSRMLVSGFAATADANVSFDGRWVLFAAKRDAQDLWQIWEVAVASAEPKQIVACDSDCVSPFFLPGDRLVYARKAAGHFVLETASLDGGAALQLTYAPGNALPTDVLRDGRILFEAAYPMGTGASPEIYTVYSDGSGVEAYRCDHGAKRQAGKQTASGDIVFASANGMARFTSARAHEVALDAPAGEFAGDALETPSGSVVVAWRKTAQDRYSLESWNPKTSSFETLVGSSDADVVQPALLTSRRIPNQHPSGLHDWNYANLLCLNAYTSKYAFAAGTIATLRLYTTNEAGKAKLLGSSNVESDGSFYVQVPADKPLQIELLDRQGKTLQREHGWWWMRKGEQRICVGCHAGPERSPENAVPAVLLKSTVPVNLTGAATTLLKGGR
jgi:hypothetical protein